MFSFYFTSESRSEIVLKFLKWHFSILAEY